MKYVYKKWWFWVIIAILLIAWWKRKEIVSMSKGIIVGPSHELGGVKRELEGGEAVINKISMMMKDKFTCEGTPREIASAVNELGGGVGFGSGKCFKLKT